MEINGMKIRDMKDVQDVLVALETIKMSLENLSEDMDKNYDNYSSTSEDLKESITNEKGIIEAINHLQVNANDLINNIEDLAQQSDRLNTKNIEALKEQIKEFENQVQKAMDTAIDKVDFSRLRQQILNIFKEKISIIDTQLEKLNKSKDDLAQFNKSMRLTLDTVDLDMKNKINSFNRLSKLVNYKTLGATFLGGIFSGFIIFTLFDISIFKDKIFKEEKETIYIYNQKIKYLDDVYGKAKSLEAFLNKNGIKVQHGYFTDKNDKEDITKPYLLIEPGQYGKVGDTDKGLIIGLFK